MSDEKKEFRKVPTGLLESLGKKKKLKKSKTKVKRKDGTYAMVKLYDVKPKDKKPDFIQTNDVHVLYSKYMNINNKKLNNNINDSKDDAKEYPFIQIVHISDTHLRHKKFTDIIPDGDILIHSGDFGQKSELNNGKIPNEIYEFIQWFDKLPHKYKIIIGGNHEICFNNIDKEYLKNNIFKSNNNNIYYIQDEMISLYGLNIYGTPWTTSYNMGFSMNSIDINKNIWNKIPNNTDILITHQPPMDILDKVTTKDIKYKHNNICNICNKRHPSKRHWGDINLRHIVMNKIKPILHLFGHVHQENGFIYKNNILFVNSAMDMIDIPHRIKIIFDK